MLKIFSSIGSIFKKKKNAIKQFKILLLGLDNAGKTTILKSVTNESLNQISPTKGFNVKLVEKDCVKFTFWDLGGQSSIRHVWENYFEGNDAIVYVIDSSDTYRLEETGNELRLILEQACLSGLPLLIFANKQDLNLSLNVEEIMDTLNLNNINDRKWNIVACSAVIKMGLQEGLVWLSNNI